MLGSYKALKVKTMNVKLKNDTRRSPAVRLFVVNFHMSGQFTVELELFIANEALNLLGGSKGEPPVGTFD